MAPMHIQTRTVQCVLVKGNDDDMEDVSSGGGHDKKSSSSSSAAAVSSSLLPDSLCVDSGLEKPAAKQKCGLSECPQWIAEQWMPCEETKCIARNTGT